jgi:DNA-binding PadR family transcriptional regulator
MGDDPVTRHFFNGFIRLHALYHAAKGPVYGAEIAEELNRHGYRLSQGTLYPTLHLLEGLGYLRSSPRVVQGRRRRYYRATAAGRAVLKQARDRLLELVAEVVEDQDRPFQTIHEKRRGRRARPTDRRRGPKHSSETRHEVDHARAGEGGPGRLPLARQEVRGPGGRVPVRPGRPGP